MLFQVTPLLNDKETINRVKPFQVILLLNQKIIIDCQNIGTIELQVNLWSLVKKRVLEAQSNV